MTTAWLDRRCRKRERVAPGWCTRCCGGDDTATSLPAPGAVLGKWRLPVERWWAGAGGLAAAHFPGPSLSGPY